jgi:phospholipid-binding lipoprotein MlaA
MALAIATGLVVLACASPAWAAADEKAIIDDPADTIILAVALPYLECPAPPQFRASADPTPSAAQLLVLSDPVPDAGPFAAVASLRTKGDPLEKFNRKMFVVHTKLDRAFFNRLAQGGKIIPHPLRDGIRNFLRNLREPLVLANDLLQLRFKQAGQSFSRFFINSVLGIGGLFDVAGKDGLKAHGNGLGGTLARWGVGPGPYLFIPLVGPTTLRDLLGGQAEGLVLPLSVGFPFNRFDYNFGRATVSGIDQRIEQGPALDALLSGSVDPYASLRSSFLQNREAEVQELKGKPADSGPDILDTPLDDPAASGSEAAPLPEPEAEDSALRAADTGQPSVAC